MRKLTITSVKLALYSMGISLIKNAYNEYRVNYLNGKTETAYFTNDLLDAYDTGLSMASHASYCTTKQLAIA